MEVDDIFSYDKLVAAEKANLQAGMNYREGRDYAICGIWSYKGFFELIDAIYRA